jgi:hypothetical protein
MADGALPTAGDQAVADTQTEIKKPSVMDDLQAERAKLYQIQAELMRQIEDRSKPDPSAFWAAMARGFGNPNTPSFAGGAAGFAGNLQASQEEERKRAIETAQMRIQLANAQTEAKEKEAGMKMLMGISGGEGVSSAMPTQTTGNVPASTADSSQAINTASSIRGRPISDQDIARAYFVSKDTGDKFKELAKMQREDLISTPDGIFSRSERRFIPADPYNVKTVKIDFPVIGAKEVPQEVAREYTEALKKYNQGNNSAINDFYVKQGFIAKGDSKGLNLPSEPQSPEQVKAAAEGLAERMKIRSKSSEEQGNAVLQRGREAYTNIQIASNMASYAESNPRAFELLQTPTLRDSILRAIDQGMQAGQFGSFSIPTRVVEQYKLDQKDIAALQMFMQDSARLTVQLRKTSRVPGEGSITESEGRLYAQVEALPTDMSSVIQMKSQLLQVRSLFDQESARLWANYQEKYPTKSFTQFELTDDYQKLKHDYNSELEKIRKANSNLLRTAPKKGPVTPQSNVSDLPPGYVRDKNTGVIRKKREGE